MDKYYFELTKGTTENTIRFPLENEEDKELAISLMERLVRFDTTRPSKLKKPKEEEEAVIPGGFMSGED